MLLAKVDEIAEGACKGFSADWLGEKLEGFLVKKEGVFYAFKNSCPHIGAPLNWMPDEFLDPEGNYIQCSMHGALFEMDSGLCVSGPCVAKNLESLSVQVAGDEVRLVID
ncbi:MAG: Rieske 2Fe-2S domain-containing protein [Chromatiales bacterium]|nr:Rieske 2Fe-2S domain-containing protein [Chromatiales bacterium]